MVVARIYEGLGNQLFQYAMGRAVAGRHGVELRLDLDWFDSDQGGPGRGSPPRTFDLPDTFHVTATRATRRELAFHRHEPTGGGRLLSKALRLGSRRLARQVTERGRRFQPACLDAGPDAYLDGYWQSPRYFDPVADAIRAEFRLRPSPAVDHARCHLDRWRRDGGGPLVSVHVRRGDLVPTVVDGVTRRNDSSPTTAAHVAAARRLFPADARFVVVADPADRAWCRRHVPGAVAYDGPTAAADFAVLSGCDHHIIAASTFSWWAAWLNPARGKRVVAPAPWVWPDLPAWKQNPDLIPADWAVVGSDLGEPVPDHVERPLARPSRC